MYIGIEIVTREFENYFEKFKENKELPLSFGYELNNRFSELDSERMLSGFEPASVIENKKNQKSKKNYLKNILILFHLFQHF